MSGTVPFPAGIAIAPNSPNTAAVSAPWAAALGRGWEICAEMAEPCATQIRAKEKSSRRRSSTVQNLPTESTTDISFIAIANGYFFLRVQFLTFVKYFISVLERGERSLLRSLHRIAFT